MPKLIFADRLRSWMKRHGMGQALLQSAKLCQAAHSSDARIARILRRWLAKIVQHQMPVVGAHGYRYIFAAGSNSSPLLFEDRLDDGWHIDATT